MPELTKRDRAYIAAVEANTPKDFPNLVCGWPDDEYDDLSHGEYLEACCAIVNAIPDGEDVGTITFPRFETWRRVVRERDEERGNLGFSHEECDLCGALAGDRYAVTALPADPATNPDYIALSVCQDCLCWIANGDLPGRTDMNCKPGDLAVVCRNLRPDSPNRGKIVRCLEVVPSGTTLPPQYRWSSGERIQLTGETWWHVDVDIIIIGSVDLSRTMCAPYIMDDRLRPLRPDDGEDETLTWAGKPNNVKEYAK